MTEAVSYGYLDRDGWDPDCVEVVGIPHSWTCWEPSAKFALLEERCCRYCGATETQGLLDAPS